jgi:hypothetical protein
MTTLFNFKAAIAYSYFSIIFNLHQWYASNKSCPNDNAFQDVQTAPGDLQSNQGVRSDSFPIVNVLCGLSNAKIKKLIKSI